MNDMSLDIPSAAKRFWKFVDILSDSECWVWTGTTDSKGYGKFNKVGGRNGTDWRAHRFAYFLHHNIDPGQNFVLHSCDNHSCVNPAHLHLVSPIEDREEIAKRKQSRPAKQLPPKRKRKKSGPSSRSIKERFWEKVDVRGPDDCWNWTAKVDRDGYGRIGTGGHYGTMLRAPRYSYLLHYGVDLGNQWVLHSCDNPSCVNPRHLRIGDAHDNNQESFDKGRRINFRASGEDNPSSKLTTKQVKEIRRRYAQGGISQTKLGAQYGVGQTIVSSIVLRKSWKHIP